MSLSDLRKKVVGLVETVEVKGEVGPPAEVEGAGLPLTVRASVVAFIVNAVNESHVVVIESYGNPTLEGSVWRSLPSCSVGCLSTPTCWSLVWFAVSTVIAIETQVHIQHTICLQASMSAPRQSGIHLPAGSSSENKDRCETRSGVGVWYPSRRAGVGMPTSPMVEVDAVGSQHYCDSSGYVAEYYQAGRAKW